MERMTFDQATDFIIERLDPPLTERRRARNRVRGRLKYALENASLPRALLNGTDVHRDALIFWARSKWPGKFEDIPIKVQIRGHTSMKFNAMGTAIGLPSSIEECHELIISLSERNRMLVTANEAQAKVIGNLKPLADRYVRNRAKNQASARRSRT